MTEPSPFYDDLSADYHLIYEDWWGAVERQGRALARVIENELGPGPKRVLDCTAGIGTQALGLSLLGHEVTGTDLSEAAVARARAEAVTRGLTASFQAWDVRDIDRFPGGPFDVVLSADNSLPHLVESGDLDRAVRGMLSQASSPGLVLVTIRDYDALLQARPSREGPRVLGSPGRRRIVLQLWDWDSTEPIYDVEHVIVVETDRGWQVSARSCRYRALRRSELEDSFRATGASRSKWLEPEGSGFFQPMLVVSVDGSH